MVNKKVWMDCFGAGVPTEDVLARDIQRLEARLEMLDNENSKTSRRARSRLCNSLQRRQKMLAAVKDGQPWAWMLYPSSCQDSHPCQVSRSV